MTSSIFNNLLNAFRNLITNSGNLWNWLINYNIPIINLSPLGLFTASGLLVVLGFVILKGILS